MYRSRFGNIFYIPAEKDVLISFAPVKNIDDNVGIISMSGKIRLRTWYQPEFNETTRNDPAVTVVPRAFVKNLPTNTSSNTTENSTTLTNETAIIEEELDNQVLIETDPNSTKVNWDGEEIPEGPWIDRELFKIGDISVTNKDVVVGSGTIVIIVIVVFSVCAFISWRKRKEIAIQARRASTYLRRASSKIAIRIR